MKATLVALHLLPHLPPSRRADWARLRLQVPPDKVSDTVHILKSAYPHYHGSLASVEAVLGGDPSRLDEAVVALRAIHQSAEPDLQRPLPGRGCRYCKAACQYGQVITVSLSGQEDQVKTFLSTAPGSPAQQLIALANTLVGQALNHTSMAFDRRMAADMAYCLATQMAGMRVGQQRLDALRVLQERLDTIRGGT